jgi:hypothetical protein
MWGSENVAANIRHVLEERGFKYLVSNMTPMGTYAPAKRLLMRAGDGTEFLITVERRIEEGKRS